MADCPPELWADTGLPLPAKAVAGCLWDIVHFQDAAPTVWQRRARLAAGLGVCRKTLDKWIVVLERRGWLRRFNGGTSLRLLRERTTENGARTETPSTRSEPTRSPPEPTAGATPERGEPTPPERTPKVSPNEGGHLSNQSKIEQYSSSPCPLPVPPVPLTHPNLPVAWSSANSPAANHGAFHELNCYRGSLASELKTRLPTWRGKGSDVATGVAAALEDVGVGSYQERLRAVKAVIRHAAELVQANKLPRAHFGGLFHGRGFQARLEAYEQDVGSLPTGKASGADERSIDELYADIQGGPS